MIISKNILYFDNYSSPLGNIVLVCNETHLLSLLIEGQGEFKIEKNEELKLDKNHPILKTVKLWLNRYFNGEKPSPDEIQIYARGTDFQKRVWKLLLEIPYGEITTYRDIAKTIAKEKNIKRMSSQAVGQAVGSNPLAIIIPCHRVIGSNGKLVGYGGGLHLKSFLLNLEQKSNV